MTERERELENQLTKAQLALAEKQRDRCNLHETMLAEIRTNMALLPGIKVKVDLLDVSINGSPEEPQKGMKVRVDRLEQKDAQRSWVIGVLVTATTGLGLTTLWAKLTGK